MAPPTRPQIEANVTLPSYTVEYHNGTTWVAIADDDVLAVELPAAAETGPTGLGFGAAPSVGGSLRLRDTPTTAAIAWENQRVRVSYGFAGSDELRRGVGILKEQTRSASQASLDFRIDGIQALIADVPMYSPVFVKRNAATATSAVSTEDPTAGGYAAGLINYILWQAGGRPADQSATYPTAVFYYACQTALFAPEYAWISGENAWEEIGRLCKACAGQVFQDVDGTIRFVTVLALAGTPSYTITDALFSNITRRTSTTELVKTARCSFTSRRVQGLQEVYRDNESRLLAASEVRTITIEPELPVYQWLTESGTTLPADTVRATDLQIAPVSVTCVLTSSAAGRATIQITNPSTAPIIVSDLVLYGRPIQVVEEGQESYGSLTPERTISEDTGVYVQSRSHAKRLCQIVVDFYGTARAVYDLTDMPYDPDRFIGEAVSLTYAAWGLTAVPCRIAKIAPKGGGTMDMTVVDTTGVPALSELFLIGTTYSSGDTRKVGY